MENFIHPMIKMLRMKRIFSDKSSFKVSPSHIIIPAANENGSQDEGIMEIYELID